MATKKKAKDGIMRYNSDTSANCGATGACGARGNEGMTLDKVGCGKGPNPWLITVVCILLVGVAYILTR